MAAAKAGLVLVPLNWRLSVRELGEVLANSRAGLLVCDTAHRTVAQQLVSDAMATIELRVAGSADGDGYEAWIAAHAASDPGGRGEADDVILQMYTSGTTGVPKGVLTDASQPRRRGVDLGALGLRFECDQPDTGPVLPHRRHWLGVLRPLALRDDDPGERLRPGGGARSARTATRDQPDIRSDDAADVGARARRRRTRLLGTALGRVRGLASHDHDAACRATYISLQPARALRPHREHRRCCAPRWCRPRPGRSAPPPAALRRPPLRVGRAAGRRPGNHIRSPPEDGRRGLATRAERDGGVLRPSR